MGTGPVTIRGYSRNSRGMVSLQAVNTSAGYQTVDERAPHGIPAVGHQVDFEETSRSVSVSKGSHRDVATESREPAFACTYVSSRMQL